MPRELGGREERLGGGRGGWRSGRPSAPVRAVVAAPVLTAGQGSLPELTALDLTLDQQGTGWEGDPEEVRLRTFHKLRHLLPSLGPPPVATELPGAEPT